MTIRPATAADVPAIAALEATAFPEDAWPAGYLADAIAGALLGTGVLVAELDGDVVGHAITSVVFEIAELQRIAVAVEHRRRGVAGLLLAAVRDLAAAQGAPALLLEVRETNAGALAFYERAGFAEIDRRPRYYRNGDTAIVMSLALQGR
ncbi:ribosomal protein S18-alanine N-acetyltransferase [Nocardioides sp.]|jgi:ribosomal-protein-alanine N-acetyltransferase|uniref:ribosomal protein S18-alanine N-acetyltransferase n=1 Tax=Nocardioides sp. TaxID=35761 RepID=UPI002CB840E7|nr:ribosomal protein S18-alanine N-acetyltransferase [Nocardioides sp.]HVX55451.1 ribosomal protein S18-alanine N-acetyltransferase [Nocardioides sp.]